MAKMAFDDKVAGILDGTVDFSPDPAIWGNVGADVKPSKSRATSAAPPRAALRSEEDYVGVRGATPSDEAEIRRLAENTAWQNLGRDGAAVDPSDHAGVDHWTGKEVRRRAEGIEERIEHRYAEAEAYAQDAAVNDNDREHAITRHLRGGGDGRYLLKR